jgi:hypothetical protein
MTIGPQRVPAPQVRAGDVDRDAMLAQLSDHFAAGRLTAADLDERSGRALSARTMGELDELTRDLPRLRGPMPPRRPSASPRRPSLLTELTPVGMAFAFVTSGITIGTPHHDWFPWWTVPLAFVLVRRTVGRLYGRGGRSGARAQGWAAHRYN